MSEQIYKEYAVSYWLHKGNGEDDENIETVVRAKDIDGAKKEVVAILTAKRSVVLDDYSIKEITKGSRIAQSISSTAKKIGTHLLKGGSGNKNPATNPFETQEDEDDACYPQQKRTRRPPKKTAKKPPKKVAPKKAAKKPAPKKQPSRGSMDGNPFEDAGWKEPNFGSRSFGNGGRFASPSFGNPFG